MLSLTKRCRNPELAWRFARHIYFDPDRLAEIFRETNILPPFQDAWTHPGFHRADAYWDGQRIGLRYIQLAPQVPVVYGSPYLQLAKDQMSNVISSCASYYNAHGEAGFADFARARLAAAADYVRKQMSRNPF